MAKKKVKLISNKGSEIEVSQEKADRLLNWCKVTNNEGAWKISEKPDKKKNE